MKQLTCRNAMACGGPHVGNIDVLFPFIVEIAPASAHAGARNIYMGFRGRGGERSITIGALQVAAAKTVGNIEVGPAVSADVSPGAGEAVAVILRIQAG